MNQTRSALSPAARKSLTMQGMQAAIAARMHAGMDQTSPICVYALSEAHEVTVRFNNITSMEGMYDRSSKPRIHLSAHRPLARRAFTCAHELGHHIFGHGSTIDELREDQSSSTSRHPDEILADAFASFALMPTLGLKEAFAKRKLKPEVATPVQIFSIACNFGVGQATLVNHLAYSVGMISQARRDELGKTTPKMIRTQLIGEVVDEPLVLADEHWNSSTLDIEQGALLLLPNTVVADVAMLTPVRHVDSGRLFRATKCGITRVAIPGSPWATYVRIAKARYVGLARYRHLEDNEDE